MTGGRHYSRHLLCPQVTKKLAGRAADAAAWATSVGNERGQVLTTVLTASEDSESLGPLAAGLVDRYRRAGQPPPAVLYTDRDCCRAGGGRTRLHELFGGWPQLVVRLDAWHFMRRLAQGVTSSSHPLYGTLMARLSASLFEWDAENVARLQRAKRAQLLASGVGAVTDRAVRTAIGRDELARHCRRRVADVQTAADRVERLLLELADATDAFGTPLISPEAMRQILAEQQHHLPCLQDPLGQDGKPLLLYARTGTKEVGGVLLPVYRCARGTTSLESYHLHLARFIPGETEMHKGHCRQHIHIFT